MRLIESTGWIETASDSTDYNLSHDGDGLYCLSSECGEVIAEFIHAAPAVDAAPVVRGKWDVVQMPSKEDDVLILLACSECKRIYSAGTCASPFPTNYCPNCGAKMEVQNETRNL